MNIKSFEVLLSTMNQNDKSFLKKMKIDSDTLIINQNMSMNFESFKYKGNKISLYSFPNKGIGISRNQALMLSNADICLFSDDDICYSNKYENNIKNEFQINKNADIIIFNVKDLYRHNYIIKKRSRVRRYNCFRYGTYQIAINRKKVLQKNITFSLLFGGNCKYLYGEDSLFLYECIKKGLKVYTSPINIGDVNHKNSTWFNGYNDDFFIHTGILFYHISRIYAFFLCLQFIVRKKKLFQQKKRIKILKLLLKGVKQAKQDSKIAFW